MRLLDLFCGAGGAAMGYSRAGFTDIVGIDVKPQPRYPFTFVQADAMSVLLDGGFRYPGKTFSVSVRSFDAIHASPPCQMYSRALKHMASPQPMLIDAVIIALTKAKRAWVVENVEGAPLVRSSDLFGNHGAVVCGTGLGLRIQRHRIFESNVPLSSTDCKHVCAAMNPHNQYGRDLMYAEFGRHDPEKTWRKEMGVEWMGRYEAREAIPPAYSEFIGRQLLAALQADRAAYLMRVTEAARR